jgi:hypothetical protein
MFVDSLFSEVVTWPVAAHVEKQGFGAQGWRFSALARCRGRWGALEVERRIGAEAGAWGGKSSRRRFGFLSQVVGAGGVAGCVPSGREGRVSCPIGGVGWWLRRVRVSETARRASNSHRFGWRGGPATRLVARFAVVVGRGVGACRSGLVSGAAPLDFGVSCFVPGLVAVVWRVVRWGPALTPRSS